MFAAIAAKWALAGGVKGVFGGIFKFIWRLMTKQLRIRVWMILALAAYGWHWHGNKVESAVTQAVSETNAKWQAKATVWKAKLDGLTANIRSKANEETRAVNRAADDLRLRGPGKAVCPGVDPGAGRYVAPAGQADAAVAPLPDPERIDLIALPFAPTIDFAEQHDACLIEAAAWRAQNSELSKLSQPKE